MPTLTQYWNEEVTRINTALTAAQADLAVLRTTVQNKTTKQRTTADDVRAQADKVTAARRALASIPMPGDGDPLLVAMENAMVALSSNQSNLALDGFSLMLDQAALRSNESLVQQLISDLAEATAAHKKAEQAATKRAEIVAKFKAGGSLENLVADAQKALTNYHPEAKKLVEGEFPSNAATEKSLLARVRERIRLLKDIETSTVRVEAPAYLTCKGALASAQRDFDAAVTTMIAAADTAAQFASDRDTLARLAALPNPKPPDSYSILTRWQHDRLHDANKKALRENTLAKLTDVDNARRALIVHQEAYDKALNAALAAEPDKTIANLNATTLAAEHGALVTAIDALDDARKAYIALDQKDRDALDKWFAAVPDTLWDALAALDNVVVRLKKITEAPTPDDLATTMDAAEIALEVALRADRLAARQRRGADRACARAQAEYQARRDMAGPLQATVPHFDTLL